MKTREFGQPCAAVPVPGRCRICGIVEDRSHYRPGMSTSGTAFGWADETRTLCDAPKCVEAARAELGLR